MCCGPAVVSETLVQLEAGVGVGVEVLEVTPVVAVDVGVGKEALVHYIAVHQIRDA